MSRISNFISHVPGRQDPDTKRQFDQLQNVIEQIAQDFTYYGGYYDGSCYNKGAIVVDGEWTMVSNKDTCDRPAPTPTGDPFYVYQGTSPTGTIVAGSLTVGNQYTFPAGGFMVGYRLYTVVGNNYTIWVQEEGGPVQQIAIFTASSTGWLEDPLTDIPIGAGRVFTLAVTVQEPDPAPTVFTLNYDYQTPQNPSAPASGAITHDRNTTAIMAVNKTDQTGDQSGPLSGLSVGDTIEGANLRWAISSISDQGTYYNFGVSPAANGFPIGVQDFTFETTTPVPITTVIDPDYFSGNAQVQPFFEIDGSGPQLSDNGYGIDILLQEADISEDWDLVSRSGGGGSSGGGSGKTVQIVDEGGFYQIVGSKMICWGTAVTDASGQAVFTFPRAFKSNPIVTALPAGNANWNVSQQANSTTGTTIVAFAAHANTTAPAGLQVLYHAVGDVPDGEEMPTEITVSAAAGSGLFMTRNKCDQRYTQRSAFKAFLDLLVVKGTMTQAEADTLDALNVVQP